MTTETKEPQEAYKQGVAAEIILESVPDTFLLLTTKGRIVHAKIGANEEALVSMSKVLVKGKPGRMLNSHLYKKIREKLNGLAKKQKPISFEAELTLNGARNWFEVRMQKVQEDTIIAVIRNITTLVSGFMSKEKFYNITEQSQELIMVTDVTGMIEYVNPRVCAVTGYSLKELVGRNARIFKTPRHDNGFYFNLWSKILKGEIYKAEFYNAKKNGDYYVEEKTITPLFNANGEITNFISTGIDITQKKRQELRAHKYRKLEVTLDKKEQKSRTLSLIKSNEIERNKLAREIHEGVNQMLSATMANLETLSAKKVITGEEKNRLELINELVSEITQELRGISSSLSPIRLYEFGLYLAAKQMAEGIASNHNLAVEFSSNTTGMRFKTEVEITIYRILQEAINNTLRHALANKIIIELNYSGQELALLIKDNGRGIAMNSLEFKKLSTFGILNIEARAKSIGAELNIKSGIDKGFSISLSLTTKLITYD